MTKRSPNPVRGVLHEPENSPRFAHHRYVPSQELASLVEHVWSVAWHVERPRAQEVLPHPSVHLTLEEDGAWITGVPTGLYTKTLEGKGRVLGVKFKPGAFGAFAPCPVSRWNNRRAPAEEVFPGMLDLLRPVYKMPTEPALIHVQGVLVSRPRNLLHKRQKLAMAAAQRAMTDRTLTRVEHLASEFGVSVRTLQRVFAEYVGVSPKWVLVRYRVHEALAEADKSGPQPWASIAQNLGYFDQAHLVREFTKQVGTSPARYAAVAAALRRG